MFCGICEGRKGIIERQLIGVILLNNEEESREICGTREVVSPVGGNGVYP